MWMFLFILIEAVCAKTLYLLPNSTGAHSWERIDTSTLVCPPYNNVKMRLPDKKDMEEIKVQTPEGYHGSEVRGTICQKILTTVRCHEHWFTGRDITYQTKQIAATVPECLSEMSKVTSKFQIIPPTPDCSYTGDKDVSVEVLDISALNVHYDPFNQSYIHPIFLGGVCHKTPCLAMSGRSLWFPSKEEENKCQLTPRRVWLERTNTSTVIHSSLHPPKRGDGCVLKYCGQTGIRFSDGEWLGMPENYSYGSLPACRDSQISIYNSLIEEGAETLISDSIKANRCLDLISRVRASKSISSWEMSAFMPDRPGLSVSYRMRGGVLERAVIRYVLAYQTKYANGTYGEDSHGRPVFWDDWVADQQHNGTWHGPNGMILSKDRNQRNVYMPETAINHGRLKKLISKPIIVTEHIDALPDNMDDDIHDSRYQNYETSYVEFSALTWILRSPTLWAVVILIILSPLIFKCIRVSIWGTKSRKADLPTISPVVRMSDLMLESS